jgi:cysteine-rich repeat protein
LSGYGVPAGNFSVADVDLGQVATNSAVPGAVTVTAMASVGDLVCSVSGADLTADPTKVCPAALAAGASCSVGFTFKATTSGQKTDSVVCNAAGLTKTAVVSATVLDPAKLVITPASTTFQTPNGTQSAPVTFGVANSGGLSTGQISATLTGANANQFAITVPGCLAPLAGASGCTVQVVCNPTSVGTKTATLTVADATTATDSVTAALTCVSVGQTTLTVTSTGTSTGTGTSTTDAGVAVCGNGILDPGETCDDGNTVSSDGCSAECQIEPGWTCPVPGQPCTPICGDGIVVGDEECDCGNGTVPVPEGCPGPNNDMTYGGCTTHCMFGPTPASPTGTPATVTFLGGTAQGAMTGYGWISMGLDTNVTNPTCTDGALVTSGESCQYGWNSADSLCMSGVIPATTDYADDWGVQIGVSSVSSVDSSGNPIRGIGISYTSIMLSFHGSPSAGLRIYVHRHGDPPSVSYCVPYVATPVPLTNFNTACWNGSGTGLLASDVPNIDMVMLDVVSTSSVITVTNLCLDSITFQ